jgi:hypothetical protein
LTVAVHRLFVFILSFPLLLLAQPADTAWIAKARHYSIQHYEKQLKGESQLFNGGDYSRYVPLRDEHPYFLSNDWQEGSLVYDHQRYDNLWLQYDITTDQLLIENYHYSNTIQLVKEQVQAFALGNRNFIQLQHPSLTSGYYELLYDGKTRAIARHMKNFQKEIQSGQLYHKFLEKTAYFLLINEQYSTVTNKGSVLRLFGERKQAVKRAFKGKNISFGANKARSIAMLSQLYDEETR